MRTNKPCL